MVVADLHDAIPKVELHCHVEGSVRPQTVLDLARKAGQTVLFEDPTELNHYTSLDAFLAIFWLVQGTLVEPADWERIAYESLVDAAPHGLRYREMFFTPARHLAAGQTLAGIIDGLTAGIQAGEADTRVHCMLIADMDRAHGPAAGRELVEQLAELRHRRRAERVIGAGMDPTELGVDLASFAEPFELARRRGFRRIGHAGEAVGVGTQNILIGLDVLGLERIDHGIAVMVDPALARRLAADRVPLTVCPNSNVVSPIDSRASASTPFGAPVTDVVEGGSIALRSMPLCNVSPPAPAWGRSADARACRGGRGAKRIGGRPSPSSPLQIQAGARRRDRFARCVEAAGLRVGDRTDEGQEHRGCQDEEKDESDGRRESVGR
jgi:adenosine deaminase